MALRYGSPSRLSTPGDLAPLALAPLQPNSTTRSPTKKDGIVNRALPQAPPLPTWSSQLLPLTSPLRGDVSRDWTDYELRLRSLGDRQNGLEQKLFQLADLFASITEEQTVQARRLADLSSNYDDLGKRSEETQHPYNPVKTSIDVSTKIPEISTLLTQFRYHIDCHAKRLLLLSNMAGRHCLHNPANPSNDDPLRKALLQWHSLTQSLKKPSRHYASTKKERAFNIRMSEMGGHIEDVQDRVGKHDVRLARIDAALKELGTTSPAKNRPIGGHTAPFSAAVEALEMLSNQAKTVDDLDFLVREELRISQQQPSSAVMEANVIERLTECVSEQGSAICELRDVLKSIANRIESKLPPSAASSDMTSVLHRVSSLEDKVVSIQQHLGVFASIVRQIRDHAADALDDRLVAAMTEMQQRLSGGLTSIHNRIRQLQGDTSASHEVDTGSQSNVFVLGGDDQQRHKNDEERQQSLLIENGGVACLQSSS